MNNSSHWNDLSQTSNSCFRYKLPPLTDSIRPVFMWTQRSAGKKHVASTFSINKKYIHPIMSVNGSVISILKTFLWRSWNRKLRKIFYGRGLKRVHWYLSPVLLACHTRGCRLVLKTFQSSSVSNKYL